MDDFDIKLVSTKPIRTTDSGSNNVSAKLQDCDILDSITCFGRQLYLAVNNSIKGFTKMSEMLRAGHAIVNFSNRSPKAYTNFSPIQVRMGTRCPFRLIQSVGTHWNLEMQKVLRLQKLSRPLAISLNVSNCTVTRTSNDWKLSEVCTAVLNGVVVATSEANTKVYHLISKTNPLLFVISSNLQPCQLKAELKDF